MIKKIKSYTAKCTHTQTQTENQKVNTKPNLLKEKLPFLLVSKKFRNNIFQVFSRLPLLHAAKFSLFLKSESSIPAVHYAGHRDALCFFHSVFENINLADGTFGPELKLRKNSPEREWI